MRNDLELSPSSPVVAGVVGKALAGAARVGSLWLLGTILALLFQATIAARLGVSPVMDAYLVAITLPVAASAIWNTALNYVIVPNLRPLTSDPIQFWRRFSSMIVAYGAIAALLLPLAWVLAPEIVRVLAPGLTSTAATLAAQLLRLLFIGLFLDMLRGIIAASYYCRGLFALPASTAAIFSLVQTVTALLLLNRIGPSALAWAWIVGYAVTLAMLVLPVVHHLKVDFHRFSRIGLLPSTLIWAMAITGMLQGGPIIDRFFASHLGVGAIAYLGYASKLTEIGVRTLPLAFGLALLPSMSDYIRAGDWDGLRRMAGASLRVTILLIVPISVALVLTRSSILAVIYQRGSFSVAATQRVSELLVWYGAALIPLSVSTVLTYLFFAKGDYFKLTILGTMWLAGLATLDGLGSLLAGYRGIAMASLASGLLLCLATLLAFFGRPAWQWRSDLFRYSGQLALALAAEAATLLVFTSLWSQLRGWQLGIALVAELSLAVGTYGLVLLSIGNRDARGALTQIVRRGRQFAPAETATG